MDILGLDAELKDLLAVWVLGLNAAQSALNPNQTIGSAKVADLRAEASPPRTDFLGGIQLPLDFVTLGVTEASLLF